jgi:acetylornithine deacetylase/succinyl-diaminopimelate desuccinylase-like protein
MFDPVAELSAFIRHKSVSADPSYASELAGARMWLARLFAGIGLKVTEVATKGHPILLAERTGPSKWPCVVIYGHYDVQPADPFELWRTPAFDPTIVGNRIYGRGAADNKGPLLAHVSAVARLLERRPELPLRIKFIVEGEEEIGSPNFRPFLEKHKRKLGADLVFFSDTGNPSPGQVVITTGLRGLVALELEVTGPNSDLHSGFHGGVLHNPIAALAELCASLHTPDGKVNVPGFYKDVRPVHPWERAEVRKLGSSLEQYRKFLDIPKFHTPPGISPFEATRFHPTLEFNGIFGGYQGAGSKTVIPSKAGVKISCRLVPDQDPERIRKLLHKTLRARCPKGVCLRIIDQHSANAYAVVPPGRSNTPRNQSPILARGFELVDQAVKEVFGKRPLYLREGGTVGSIEAFKSVLGLDSIMLGMFLPEDNLHAPNESFDLGVYAKGSQVSEAVLEGLAQSVR